MALSTPIPSGPQSTSPLGSGYSNIQALAAAINERLESEHYSTLQPATPGTHESLHKAGSAIAFFDYDAPLTRIGGTAFNNDFDRGLLWLRPMPSTWAVDGITHVELYALKDATGGTFDEKWQLIASFGTAKADVIEELTTDAGVTIAGTKFDRDAEDDPTIETAEVLATDKVTVGDGANPTIIEPERVRTKTLNIIIGRPTTPENGDIWIE